MPSRHTRRRWLHYVVLQPEGQPQWQDRGTHALQRELTLQEFLNTSVAQVSLLLPADCDCTLPVPPTCKCSTGTTVGIVISRGGLRERLWDNASAAACFLPRYAHPRQYQVPSCRDSRPPSLSLSSRYYGRVCSVPALHVASECLHIIGIAPLPSYIPVNPAEGAYDAGGTLSRGTPECSRAFPSLPSPKHDLRLPVEPLLAYAATSSRLQLYSPVDQERHRARLQCPIAMDDYG